MKIAPETKFCPLACLKAKVEEKLTNDFSLVPKDQKLFCPFSERKKNT